MFAQLGNIQFEYIRYFESIQSTKSFNYVENRRIGKKPTLHFGDESLEEIPIKVKFHANFCNPTKEIKKLEDAQKTKQPLAFIYGNGEYKGKYVITDITKNPIQADNLGNVIALDADIKLKECPVESSTTGKKQPSKSNQIKKKVSGKKKKTSTSTGTTLTSSRIKKITRAA